jgi:hypothetical protein
VSRGFEVGVRLPDSSSPMRPAEYGPTGSCIRRSIEALDAPGDWYDGVSYESRFDKATGPSWGKVRRILAS